MEQKPIGNTKEELKATRIYGNGQDLLPVEGKKATHANTYSDYKGSKVTLIGRG